MSLVPRWQKRLPSLFGRRSDLLDVSNIFDALDEELGALTTHAAAGLSVSADDKNVYVEAHVPGLTAKDVEVTIDHQGMLWVKGEKREEEKDKAKKYYRKAVQSFTYCLPLWDEIDEKAEPQATCKDGVMRIIFAKKKEKQAESKKIQVKEEK